MNSAQRSTERVLPRPGPAARAVFRCALFAAIPIIVAQPIGWILSVDALREAAGVFALPLLLLLFVLSCGFLTFEWRLALLGFVSVALILLVGFAFPAVVA